MMSLSRLITIQWHFPSEAMWLPFPGRCLFDNIWTPIPLAFLSHLLISVHPCVVKHGSTPMVSVVSTNPSLASVGNVRLLWRLCPAYWTLLLRRMPFSGSASSGFRDSCTDPCPPSSRSPSRRWRHLPRTQTAAPAGCLLTPSWSCVSAWTRRTPAATTGACWRRWCRSTGQWTGGRGWCSEG